MNTFKIKIHSTVDVITNSSTVIFTYQEGSVEPLKELIKSFSETFGLTDVSIDDMFNITVLLEDNDTYYEEGADADLTEDEIKTAIDDVIKGNIEKPSWMLSAEEKESYSGYNYPTTLTIHVKDGKYNKLAEALLKFINSPSHEAFRDG